MPLRERSPAGTVRAGSGASPSRPPTRPLSPAPQSPLLPASPPCRPHPSPAASSLGPLRGSVGWPGTGTWPWALPALWRPLVVVPGAGAHLSGQETRRPGLLLRLQRLLPGLRLSFGRPLGHGASLCCPRRAGWPVRRLPGGGAGPEVRSQGAGHRACFRFCSRVSPERAWCPLPEPLGLTVPECLGGPGAEQDEEVETAVVA